MYNDFKQYLNSFVRLEENEWETIIQVLEPIYLKKGDYFIKAGTICNLIAFLNKGVVRFYVNEDGEEITICLDFPKKFVSAYNSFVAREPTNENAHALEDTELFIISYNNLQEIYKKIPKIQEVTRKIIEKEVIDAELRTIYLQSKTAKEKYAHLLKNGHPDIIKKIPLQYIASYLGISQETLSRVRKRIYQL